jgi:signal transduction histidine kinase
MKLQLAFLFALALAAQLVNAAWHGFDPVEDGLQLISAGTLATLVLRVSRAWSQRRKLLILQVLDEIGQPVTVLQGYISMLADGTLRSLNGHAELLQGECERLRGITRKLVHVIREQG